MDNIRTVVERAALAQPEKTYLHFRDVEVTYRDFDNTINRAANAFLTLGIRKGDRVALLLPNSPEFLYTWLGLNKIGASMVPINVAFKGREVEYILNHSEAKMLVADADHLAVMVQIKARCPSLQKVLGWENTYGGEVLSLGELVTSSAPEVEPVEIHADDEASILYTSGTTGHPKGCVEPHSYYIVAGTVYSRQLRLGPKDRVLTPLPLFHMNPQVLSTMGTLMAGGSLILVDRFHPSIWWDEIRSKQATVFHYLGVIPAVLMGLPERPNDRDHPARTGLGAGVSAGIHARFEERFGVKLIEVFGMTETGLNFCCSMEGERKVGTQCFGEPFAEYEARVADDAGADVPVGEMGELLLRGADPANRKLGFMKEYYKEAQATEDAWRGGWFHTGDIVRRDEDGYYYFVDRKKDIVRRSGENISSSEVEAIIRSHPRVLDVAVIPVPDPIRMQEVKACIVLKPGESPQTVPPENIISWCEERLAYFKVPRYVEYRASFPRTPTEKVQKAVLRNERADLTAGCYDRTTGRWKRE
ncbi:MAG: ATP-dependent acyl-CoA ligase [Chloroflexi bacterium]|nr:ATP-dependent acyl-CoA ligase [Chloroflexota bacterium]